MSPDAFTNQEGLLQLLLEKSIVHFSRNGSPATFRKELTDLIQEIPGVEAAALCSGDPETLLDPDSPICIECPSRPESGPDRCDFKRDPAYRVFSIPGLLPAPPRVYLRFKDDPPPPVIRDLNLFFSTLGPFLDRAYLTDSLDRVMLLQQEAQELANIGNWEMDYVHGRFYSSEVLNRMLQYSADELPPTYELHRNRLPLPDGSIQSVSGGEQKARNQLVHRIHTPDRKLLVVEENCYHEFDSEGNLIRSIGTVMDITNRETAEAYRRRNAKRMQLLLQLNEESLQLSEQSLCDRGLEIAVQITDSRVGYLHFINEDRETLSLITWNEEARKFCTAAYDSHYPIAEAGIWADSIRMRKPVIHNDYQNEPMRKGYPEGHFPIYRHMSVPVMDGTEPRMILGVGNKEAPYDEFDQEQLQLVGNDIMKFIIRHRIEAELSTMNRELSMRVEQEIRERRKGEQILSQQSRMAAMGELIGMIGHQWKQPLNTLAMLVQDIPESYQENAMDTEYLKKFEEESMEQILYMSRTIEDFRNFYKPSTEKTWFDLRRAAETSVNMVRNIYDKINIRIDLQEGPPDERLESFGYPNEFQQVIINLLSNAKDAILEKRNDDPPLANREGLIRLTLFSENGEFVLQIEDNGTGIDPNIAWNMFEPYTSTKGKDGTGVGLSMARTIIETRMSGRILASSTGNGALFEIRLPETLS